MALAQRRALAAYKAVTPKSPTGYMRGPLEVYAWYIRLHPGIAQIRVTLFRDSLAGIGVTARAGPGGSREGRGPGGRRAGSG